MKILTLSSLFPSRSRPRHGIFVERRLGYLRAADPSLEVRVVAPVPWFPFPGAAFGDYGRMAATARRELREGVEIRYPRYPMLPAIGMRLQPGAMAWSAMRETRRLRAEGFDFDLIDAHYLYPDGVAAAAVARRFDRPLVLSARGSDVNVIAQMPGPHPAILAAARQAEHVIAVSAPLKDEMIKLGVAADKITVLRNGVDTRVFFPEERAAARAQFDLPAGERLIASVGNLVRGKGHDLAVLALRLLRNAALVIVGHGPDRQRLTALAHEAGVEARVAFVPEMPQARLRLLYSAADVLVLPSQREGWPNVVLEALACGTPVVATYVGGVREIAAAGAAVRVMSDASPEALAQSLGELFADYPDPLQVRAQAERFGWGEIVTQQLALYRGIACRNQSAEHAGELALK